MKIFDGSELRIPNIEIVTAEEYKAAGNKINMAHVHEDEILNHYTFANAIGCLFLLPLLSKKFRHNLKKDMSEFNSCSEIIAENQEIIDRFEMQKYELGKRMQKYSQAEKQ
ncbi:MAG: hypothetical protein LBK26_02945 [Rickettsiales bacterium]|jgi:hypothetical protein|nr:hypothetical protein [Rickettsiales bacterium]